MSARSEILRRVRRALSDVEGGPEDEPVTWSYGQPLGTQDVLADLIEKIEDYKARVVRVTSDALADAVTQALHDVGTEHVVVPTGLPADIEAGVTAAGVEVHRDDPVLSHEALNEIDTVVTTAAVAMADSGTIALDHGPGQGRRALSLLPDQHICIVSEEQVVSDVPEGITRLQDAVRRRRPITWISGGSATSDIELSRVEGVHGPRTLYVILVS